MKLVLLLIATYLVTVKSWWENGHLLTAQIAKILLQKEHPNVYKRANDLVLAMNNLDYDYDNTFVTSSCWADDIKDKAMNFWDDWHFYGRPVNPDGIYLIQDELQATSNAQTALERAMLELDDSNGTEITLQKAIFIRYVIHIVGDVHQPLHSIQYYNATYDGPKGDMGGNLQTIYDVEGQKMNLHAFWDQGAEYFQTEGDNWIERPFNKSTAKLMEYWALELMGEFPESDLGDLAKELDPAVWTTESWEIASNFTYPYLQTSNQLDQNYQDQAQQICKKRVVLAGHRLANTLIALYKDYDPEQPPQANIKEQPIHTSDENDRKIEEIVMNIPQFLNKKFLHKKPQN